MNAEDISLTKDYTQLSENKPDTHVEISTFLPKNHSVLLVSELVDRMDHSRLLATYSRLGRKTEVPPVVMLKIIVFAYFKNLFSSRKIAAACRESIPFIWLLEGANPPHYTAIAAFRSIHLADGIMEDYFFEFVYFLNRIGEVVFENYFQDGTKIEANANPYSFVWLRAVQKNREKMHAQIKAYLAGFNERYGTDFCFDADDVLGFLWRLKRRVDAEVKELGISFVKGKGSRKTPFQRDAEAIGDWIVRETGYLAKAEIAGGRSSFSKTDRDATFMRLNKDHMKNDQLKPAYNVQAAVEGGYFINIGIYRFSNDMNTMIPMLSKFQERFSTYPENGIMDAGYESEENLKFLEEKGIVAYVKPSNYEQSKKRSYKKQIGRRENMAYNPKKDEYTCAKGRKLPLKKTETQKTKTGYERVVSIYECVTCNRCPLRSQCTKAKKGNNKTLQVSKEMVRLREASHANITTKKGVNLRVNRSIQSEGGFGWIKENYGFRRFLLRGEGKVSIEILLLAFSLNVKKLHNKIQSGNLGKLLHDVKVAV